MSAQHRPNLSRGQQRRRWKSIPEVTKQQLLGRHEQTGSGKTSQRQGLGSKSPSPIGAFGGCSLLNNCGSAFGNPGKNKHIVAHPWPEGTDIHDPAGVLKKQFGETSLGPTSLFPVSFLWQLATVVFCSLWFFCSSCLLRQSRVTSWKSRVWRPDGMKLIDSTKSQRVGWHKVSEMFVVRVLWIHFNITAAWQLGCSAVVEWAVHSCPVQ